MDLALQSALFVAGLVFGSFLNVCISRIPREQSIVSPGSHCPHCNAPIRWRHNIPLLSYLLLGGRCATCRERISLRYLAVELLTAVLFAAVGLQFGVTWQTLKLCIFCFLVLGLIFMDAETGLLPAEFTYSGIFAGLALAWIAPVDSSGTRFLLGLWALGRSLSAKQLSVLDAVIAALFGAAFFYVIWGVYYLVRHRHGMGFGDFALSAMCGAFLGLKLLIFVLFCAPLMGTVLSLLFLRGTHAVVAQPDGKQAARANLSREVPFGVYLGIGALMAVFFGERAWTFYLGRMF